MLDASNTKQDGSENVDVLGVEIVPYLTVAIEHAASIHIHIITTELEECSGILEGLVEGVGLPIVGVISELDVALNVWRGVVSQLAFLGFTPAKLKS